ncbi:hypothetical protein D2Q93_02185 [Alicyclobacillaceae bacterium I2511]|nr:hypothetical protein D2Q93_02185 [Alicyclobacillaceae bacterium I2511]
MDEGGVVRASWKVEGSVYTRMWKGAFWMRYRESDAFVLWRLQDEVPTPRGGVQGIWQSLAWPTQTGSTGGTDGLMDRELRAVLRRN